MSMPRAIALIPARAGSSRVPGKNIRVLGGHPLIAYTIRTALAAGVFDRIIVSTDSPEIASIAEQYGAEVPFLRPSQLATNTAPDIDWIQHAFQEMSREHSGFDLFSILRPTSPFRTPETVSRAFREFMNHDSKVDSIRAVQLCREHPGKMWVLVDGLIEPLLDSDSSIPMHSRQYQDLPKVYIQNSSLEIARVRVLSDNSISGRTVAPFFTQGLEGFTIDYPEDWATAEREISSDGWKLPAT